MFSSSGLSKHELAIDLHDPRPPAPHTKKMSNLCLHKNRVKVITNTRILRAHSCAAGIHIDLKEVRYMDAGSSSSGSSSSGSTSACLSCVLHLLTSRLNLSVCKDSPISHLCLTVASCNAGVDAYAESTKEA